MYTASNTLVALATLYTSAMYLRTLQPILPPPFGLGCMYNSTIWNTVQERFGYKLSCGTKSTVIPGLTRDPLTFADIHRLYSHISSLHGIPGQARDDARVLYSFSGLDVLSSLVKLRMTQGCYGLLPTTRLQTPTPTISTTTPIPTHTTSPHPRNAKQKRVKGRAPCGVWGGAPRSYLYRPRPRPRPIPVSTHKKIRKF